MDPTFTFRHPSRICSSERLQGHKPLLQYLSGGSCLGLSWGLSLVLSRTLRSGNQQVVEKLLQTGVSTHYYSADSTYPGRIYMRH